jgi:hypothetical protein
MQAVQPNTSTASTTSTDITSPTAARTELLTPRYSRNDRISTPPVNVTELRNELKRTQLLAEDNASDVRHLTSVLSTAIRDSKQRKGYVVETQQEGDDDDVGGDDDMWRRRRRRTISTTTNTPSEASGMGRTPSRIMYDGSTSRMTSFKPKRSKTEMLYNCASHTCCCVSWVVAVGALMILGTICYTLYTMATSKYSRHSSGY